MNRETWLNEVKNKFLIQHFNSVGYEIPNNVRLTCGLPSRKAFGQKQKTIGQCWSDNASQDSHFEIMISPTIANNQIVISTLIHELVHAVVGLKNGHNKVFKRCAVAVGLEGKMTATTSSDNLKDKIEEWSKDVGTYPHAILEGMTDGIKKQSTRMIKCECDFCGYYGNPRFLATIDWGITFKTSVDSMLGYSIQNYDNKMVTVTVGTHYGTATLNSIESV